MKLKVARLEERIAPCAAAGFGSGADDNGLKKGSKPKGTNRK